MIREYKFRGKQLEDIKENETRYGSKKGEWRYGSYLYAHKYRHGEHAHLICNIYGEECIMCDKDTIGQYTGLKDKNGVEICEGDILAFTNKWEWYRGSAKNWFLMTKKEQEDWVNEQPVYTVEVETIFTAHDIGKNELSNYYEVIGNIHEMKG